MAWAIPQLNYAKVLIDGGQIAGIGDAYMKGRDRRTAQELEAARKAVLAGGVPTGPDGRPAYGDLASQLFAIGDADTAMGFTRLAETQAERDWERSRPIEVAGGRLIDPGTYKPVYEPPPDPSEGWSLSPGEVRYDAQGNPIASAPPKPPTMGASDRKALYASEDEALNVEGTISALEHAKELNSKTFSGAGASTRAWAGSKLPDWAVPDAVADRTGAEATNEWQNIMSAEAIKTMSQALTGATTNFELQKFEQLLSDPSTPPKTRENVINRMIYLAKRKASLLEDRTKELRGMDAPASSEDLSSYIPEPGEASPDDLIAAAGPEPGEVPATAPGEIPQITDEADFQALPSGALFIAPDGSTRRKP
jgi:hypothetical protein